VSRRARRGLRLADTSEEGTTQEAPDDRESLDLATLRLAWEEVQLQAGNQRQLATEVYTELLALPASLGVLITLLTAFRPEKAELWVNILYAIGLVPFGVIVWISANYAMWYRRPPKDATGRNILLDSITTASPSNRGIASLSETG
jgi:hypothetical protein